MNEQKKIENCYRQMYEGMITKNNEMLNSVLDKTFVLIHMTGMRQTKEEFIHAVEDRTLIYFSANHQQIEIEFNEDTAKLLGKSVVSAAVFGGGRHTWRLAIQMKLIKRENTWRITEAAVSTY